MASAAEWPTPNASALTSDTTLTCSGDGREKPNKLGWAVAVEPDATAVNHWPTPGAADGQKYGEPVETWERRRTACEARGVNKQEGLTIAVKKPASATPSEPLSPDWVCCLMGFPIGWTRIDGPPVAAKRSTPASPRARRRVSRSEPQG